MGDLTTSEKWRAGTGLTAFLMGLIVFLWRASEMLAHHTDWSAFRTPPGVGEIFLVMASALVAVAGAVVTDFDKLITVFRGGSK